MRADPEAKPGVTNLLRIYSALSGEPVATLEAKYEGAGYGAFKKDLAELVVATFAPIRERTEHILADEAGLDRLLAHGAARARQVAGPTMTTVRERIGLLKPAGPKPPQHRVPGSGPTAALVYAWAPRTLRGAGHPGRSASGLPRTPTQNRAPRSSYPARVTPVSDARRGRSADGGCTPAPGPPRSPRRR